MMKIKELISTYTKKINSSTPKLDVEVILCHILNCDRSYLIAHDDEIIESDILKKMYELLSRRALGEPVAYVVGEKEFWGLSFKVNSSVLIPRPETELLVEEALAHCKTDSAILDLGTGSGAIACAIAHERSSASVVACDQSELALGVAKDNAARLDLNNVQFVKSDWYAQLPTKKFDIIVSNPPYIKDGDEHLSQGDVRFEPESALASGKDGLDDIEKIIEGAGSFLKPDGVLLFEFGYDQTALIETYCKTLGNVKYQFAKDLSGINRVLKLWAPSLS